MSDCKQAHTPCPTGYVDWQYWAFQKSKTHKQTLCPVCGLYAIWVPKAKSNG